MVFDSGESVVLSMDLVLEHGLSKGMELDEETLREITNAQRKIKVKSTAYNYATYKPRTKKQTTIRLKERGFADDEIELAMDFLAEFNLIDDNKYAENFVKEYIIRKPSGEAKVRSELYKKGIDRYIIDDAIENYYPNEDCYSLAMKAAEKKIRTIGLRINESDKYSKKKRNSLAAYLHRQGFDWDVIKRVVDEMLNNEQ